MVAKELIDARWKAVIGMALAAILTIATALTFDLLRNAITPAQLDSASRSTGLDIASRLANFSVYTWNQTFSVGSNAGVVLMIVAALLGASVIAAEVSKGTIFLLLSRPLSRERILLTKYLVAAALLFCMNALTGLVLALSALIAGHPQNIGGIATSNLLFWLGTLFVLGVSTLFSVVFTDVLRPVALTVGIVLLLSLPGLLPHGGDWVLPGYWSSLPAFLGQEFPIKALLISLAAALLPILTAVPLFRRQQY